MKICTKCKQNKTLADFSKNKCKPDGLHCWCKPCCKEYVDKNKEVLKLRSIKYRVDNAAALRFAARQSYAKKRSLFLNKEKEKYREKKKQQPDFYIIKNREYYQKTKEIRNAKEKERKKSDVQFRLAKRLRHRLHAALKGKFKSGSAVSNLGCSIEDFKQYIETLFLPGMSWDNWGLYGWHLDHKIPLSKFDLTDSEQLKSACHYTNLQPLWAKDNLSKGNK